MAQVKVYFDRQGNTLTVWFGNPQEEYVCEETGEEVVLMKDRGGKVIGFEKLNFSAEQAAPFRGHADQFSTDHLALAIAEGAIAKGLDKELEKDERKFL